MGLMRVNSLAPAHVIFEVDIHIALGDGKQERKLRGRRRNAFGVQGEQAVDDGRGEACFLKSASSTEERLTVHAATLSMPPVCVLRAVSAAFVGLAPLSCTLSTFATRSELALLKTLSATRVERGFSAADNDATGDGSGSLLSPNRGFEGRADVEALRHCEGPALA